MAGSGPQTPPQGQEMAASGLQASTMSSPVKDGQGVLARNQLDLQKLHGLPAEQQQLYILNFTADLARHVESLDEEAATENQVELKREILQIISLSQPAPSRVVRNNLGRCFAGILGKGNRKVLYESVNDLVAIINATAKESDFRAKHAAVTCLGRIFETAGDSAISISPLACVALSKLAKSATHETGLRAASFKALGMVVRGIAVALDEDVAKSVWKQTRSALAGEKSYHVQKHACACLEQLLRCTPYFDNSNEFEKLQTSLQKAMESGCPSVRHAAASCFAAALVKSYSQFKDATPKARKPKKTKKPVNPQDLDEEELGRASSPALEKPATALTYTLPEMLRLLSAQFCRPSASNRVRAGIAMAYINLFRQLGEGVIEEKYGDIAQHLFTDVLSSPTTAFGNRYRLLISRKFVRIILERVVGSMLGETAQLSACRWILSEIIKDYPQSVKERPEPGKHVLVGAICALTNLVTRLDAAVSGISDSIREGLLQVLQHPSYTVQIYAAKALRALVLAAPQQLLPSASICMNSLGRELGLLTSPRYSPRRCIGYAHGLAAVLSTASQRPLDGSVDVYAGVLQQATSLLKSSGSSDLRISSCKLQVAWIMIGGLMSLGPNFVKIHLPQLMLWWKNALPKPLGKDHMTQRNMLELSYLTHVRECALGSIKAFLTFNQRLLTLDLTRRLSSMLENSVVFLHSLPEKRTSDDPANRLSPALQLYDYELMVRRSVFQCFAQLLESSPAGSLEVSAHSTILPLATSTLSEPTDYAPSRLSQAIASTAASFEDLWELGDQFGYGVTGLTQGLRVLDPISGQATAHWATSTALEAEIDEAILSPICPSAENDGTSCYLERSRSLRLPSPPATEAIDAAISVFGLSLPLQSSNVQESTLEQVSSNIEAPALQKDPARKAAITVNVSLALLTVCKVSAGETRAAKGDLRHTKTELAIQALLHVCLKDTDEIPRHIAAAALGRLCCGSGNTLTVSEVSYLTDTVVKNREPHVRAGCALGLASIHSQLGGMAAGFHMKTIVGILMSLAADTHPLVHIWALDGLAHVAESAGLNFSGYVTSALGMLGQVYGGESHNTETSALASSNIAMMLPMSATAAVARGVGAIANVLGPDLQDMTKPRDMIINLVSLFSSEEDFGIRLESLRCLEHLSLYAPGHLDFADYVKRLQKDIASPDEDIRQCAIRGLFILMRRDAMEVVRIANPGLEDALWERLNTLPHQEHVRGIFTNWLQQTGTSDPVGWIHRCNEVLTKTQSKTVTQRPPLADSQAITGGADLQDEEVAGFAAAAGVNKEEESAAPSSTQELMRWQVRLFAMECLRDLIGMVAKEDAVRVEESASEAALQQKVGDVIRIAFSASTAGVTSLRVVGLKIVDQILQMFGKTPDPDFPEAMLLEQFQAQISSALTPAFAADSSPELAAEAVNVCATFIATGIVTDIERMGRILKLLVGALESFSRDERTTSIGDLKGLSSNAQVMVRMAVFSAWAELQIASTEQKYLVDVVKPHIARLLPLWLTSLREYSRLRFEPDISATTGNAPTGDLDTVYAALNRQTLLNFYQDAWLSLVDAIASLIDEDSELAFDALDGKHLQATGDTHSDEDRITLPNGMNRLHRHGSGIDYREEPVAFFFVLFGLAFESLAVRSTDDDIIARQRTLDILRALKKILRPSVSGNAVYQEVVFAETMDLLDRMVLTESLGVQAIIVDIARNLCLVHPSSRHGNDVADSSAGETLSEDIEQLFELTRIIVLVLAGLIPSLSETPVSARLEGSDEAVALVRTALQALVDVSEVFPAIIKTDLHATILHIFVTIISTGVCQNAVVPQSLPTLRRFVSSISGDDRPESANQLRSALGRMLIILRNAQKRETEVSLPCEKNTLLAITILISSAPTELPDTDTLVRRFAVELCACLEAPSTSRVAAGCLRTLLSAHIATSTMLTEGLAFLIAPSDLDGIDESKSVMAQTLATWACRASPDQTPAAILLVVQALLARAAQAGPRFYPETAARMLEMANADGRNFRAVVASMDSVTKGKMEEVLRSGAQSRKKSRDFEGDNEPTIALRMDFGG